MDPYGLIEKYYAQYPDAKKFLVEHSRLVADKALKAAGNVKHLNPGMKFIEEAALLHDIGIFMTNAPMLGCRGDKPYICHGVLGRILLEGEGLMNHALVCERHVGVGLTADDVMAKKFPVPVRDMLPLSLEEKIVCFADKFYSKVGNPLEETPLEKIRAQIKRYGSDKLRVFDGWLEFFESGGEKGGL